MAAACEPAEDDVDDGPADYSSLQVCQRCINNELECAFPPTTERCVLRYPPTPPPALTLLCPRSQEPIDEAAESEGSEPA